jgi:hypothetical protein
MTSGILESNFGITHFKVREREREEEREREGERGRERERRGREGEKRERGGEIEKNIIKSYLKNNRK